MTMSSALAMEILQSFTKPLGIWRHNNVETIHDASPLISYGRVTEDNSLKMQIFSTRIFFISSIPVVRRALLYKTNINSEFSMGCNYSSLPRLSL